MENEEGAAAALMEPGGAVAAYRAEQETQASIARAYPRNPRKALDLALLELDIVPEYAVKAYYSLPFKKRVGDEVETVLIEGPSIKAALSLIRNWGNNSSGWRVKDQSTERIEVEGVYVDHETNVRTVRTKVVSRFYNSARGGARQELREDALVKAIAAAGSKAVRDAALSGMPVWYTDSYYQKARKIAATMVGGKAAPTAAPKTYAEKVAWIRDQVAKKGVSAEAFARYVAGQDATKTEDDRIADMLGAYNAVVDGHATLEEVYGDGAAKKDAAGAPTPQAAKKPLAADVPPKDAKAKIGGVAKTDYDGAEATVLRTDTDPVVKYFTQDAAVKKAAEHARDKKAELAFSWEERTASDGTKHRWVVALKA